MYAFVCYTDTYSFRSVFFNKLSFVDNQIQNLRRELENENELIDAIKKKGIFFIQLIDNVCLHMYNYQVLKKKMISIFVVVCIFQGVSF